MMHYVVITRLMEVFVLLIDLSPFLIRQVLWVDRLCGNGCLVNVLGHGRCPQNARQQKGR